MHDKIFLVNWNYRKHTYRYLLQRKTFLRLLSVHLLDSLSTSSCHMASKMQDGPSSALWTPSWQAQGMLAATGVISWRLVLLQKNILQIWRTSLLYSTCTTSDLFLWDEFLESSLTFLGYEVSLHGVKPPLDTVKAMIEFPLPWSVTGFRHFMGMMNIFRQMIR